MSVVPGKRRETDSVEGYLLDYEVDLTLNIL